MLNDNLTISKRKLILIVNVVLIIIGNYNHFFAIRLWIQCIILHLSLWLTEIPFGDESCIYSPVLIEIYPNLPKNLPQNHLDGQWTNALFNTWGFWPYSFWEIYYQ